MRTICVLWLVMAASPARANDFDHALWDRVLKAHVNPWGEVDYGAIKSNSAELDAYLAQLHDSSPDSHPERFPTRETRLTYWLNAYNAFTVAGVVAGYPTKSIRDLGFLWGFLRKKAYLAGGDRMSLNHIEHRILRKRFEDARIHFAIVCASVSCPRLSRDAFRPDTVNQRLDALARRFISEDRHVTVEPAANRLTLSKIFDWFEDDFARDVKQSSAGRRPLVVYLLQYAGPDKKQALESLRRPKIRHHQYDWSLNGPASLPKSQPTGSTRDLRNQ